MYADVTLNSLAVRPRVSRIISQQGRVQLDSDANEQTAALLYYLRALGEDVIGVHAGIGPSFRISLDAANNIWIAYGHYYVDGIRCDNLPANFNLFTAPPVASGILFADQPDLPSLSSEKDARLARGAILLVYLDVWERHISSAQDDSIREVALGGPDTAGRALIVWQVRTLVPDEMQWRKVAALTSTFVTAQTVVTGTSRSPLTFLSDVDAEYLALNMYLRSSALLTAQAGTTVDTDPCVISPDAHYRGTENQLIRVEIHDGDPNPTFKWAYDAGSTVFPIIDVQGSKIIVESLGRDDRTSLTDKHWVEIVDDDATLLMHPHPLRKVTLADRTRMEVTVDGDPLKGDLDTNAADLLRVKAGRPILRRWEDMPQPITITTTPNAPFTKLRSGIEIRFSSVAMPIGGFRTGNYWLIPARTATGDLIWPRDPQTNTPLPQPPHGVEHHYAPLALLGVDRITDLRRVFEPIRVVPPPPPAGSNRVATPMKLGESAPSPAKAVRKKRS
jgi:hypothetical protein